MIDILTPRHQTNIYIDTSPVSVSSSSSDDPMGPAALCAFGAGLAYAALMYSCYKESPENDEIKLREEAEAKLQELKKAAGISETDPTALDAALVTMRQNKSQLPSIQGRLSGSTQRRNQLRGSSKGALRPFLTAHQKEPSLLDLTVLLNAFLYRQDCLYDALKMCRSPDCLRLCDKFYPQVDTDF